MPKNYCPYEPDSLSEEQYKRFFTKYLQGHHRRDICCILAEDDTTQHFGLVTNFMWILEADQKIGSILLAYPEELFPLFEEGLIAVQRKFLAAHKAGIPVEDRPLPKEFDKSYDESNSPPDGEQDPSSRLLRSRNAHLTTSSDDDDDDDESDNNNDHENNNNNEDDDDDDESAISTSRGANESGAGSGRLSTQEMRALFQRSREWAVKENVHVRIDSLHMCPEICLVSGLPLSSDVGKFLEIQGTVIRTGHTRMFEYQRTYCCNKCGKTTTLTAGVETAYQFEVPLMCSMQKQAAGGKKFGRRGGRGCNGMVRPVESLSVFRDMQEIRIQEHVNKVGVGSIPRQVSVILLDDLVDHCQAGDTVMVIGEVHTRWNKERPGERCEVEIVVVANNVRTDNDEKRSSALTDDLRLEFARYWEQHRATPLAARDAILRSICPTIYGLYLVKLAVALVLIGGVERNGAGGMHIRGQCHLLLVGEPGTGKSQFLKYASKLGSRHVLATGGGTSSAGLTVAASKEAGGEWVLEAGALVLADGGVCCIDEFSSVKTQDKATIHEAMEQQTISVAKAGIVCRLHTRTAVLAATNAKGRYDTTQSLSVNVALASPLLSRFDMVLLLLDTHNPEWDEKVASFILSGRSDGSQAASIWPIEKLQSYISYIKTSVKPVMSREAEIVLMEYYQRQRNSDLTESARSTVRLLESLIRLSEAHARLMLREVVSVQDAVFSIVLVESSLATSAIGNNVTSALHYIRKESEIIHSLGLEDTIPPFDPSTTVMHKFKFLDDDMNGSDGNDGGSSEGSSGSSVPNTGLCEKVSTWDYDNDEEGLITGSTMGSFSSSSSEKRSIHEFVIDDDDDCNDGGGSGSYGSYPDRKRRKE